MEFLGYDLSETKDLLNMVLTIGFGLIAVVLVMVLVRVYRILGKVHNITDSVEEIVEVVNHYLWQPARIMMKIMEKIKKFFGKKK